MVREALECPALAARAKRSIPATGKAGPGLGLKGYLDGGSAFQRDSGAGQAGRRAWDQWVLLDGRECVAGRGHLWRGRRPRDRQEKGPAWYDGPWGLQPA